GDSRAAAEPIDGRFETAVGRRCGPGCGVAAVELATLARGDRLDHRRRPGPIGHVPATEAEARSCAGLAAPAAAA
ncbi:IS3 family transposase, partial [Geminicoccaceae bacterium SYSU G07066]